MARTQSLIIMQFFVEKIIRLQIGWNERPLSEADFYRLCKRHKVSVEEMPLRVGGFYYRMMGRDFIAVNSRLRNGEKLEVMFHELGHFLFHTPETGETANFHGVGRRTRKEREADIFALCAIIPKCWVENRRPHELVEDEGLSASMVAARHEISRRYGI